MIGREKEKKELLRYTESKEAELVVVYGRRRVGKTYLIKETFGNSFAFYHTGLSPVDIPKTNILRAQLHHFNQSLKNYWQGYDGEDPKEWLDAFYLLRDYLKELPKDKKQVVFIDEMPWMATPRSGFITAFEAFWNGWASTQNNIYVIVCGSATSWIVDNLLNNYGGLYGRVSHRLFLNPFTLKQCEEYEQERNSLRSRDEILRGYMIFGGIPYYWKQLDPELSLVQNVDNLFFHPNGALRNEFESLYASAFRNHKKYVKIIEALKKKKSGLSRDELIKELKIKSSGNLSKALKDLEDSAFIYSYVPAGQKEYVYMITDFLTLFHFEFIEGKKDLSPEYWSGLQEKTKLNNWQGLAFELVCMVHANQIKHALQFASVQSTTSLYRSASSQIDLLFIRNDKTVSICEIKYVQEPYELTASDDLSIRRRISELKKIFKSNTSYKITFIAPYGIKKGINSSLVKSQVTLDQLFEM